MGNTAVVLSDQSSKNSAPVLKRGNFVDKHKDVPSLSEWQNYMRTYATRMNKNKKCMHCFVEYKNMSSLLAHLANNHHPTVSFSTSESSSGEPMCVACRKTFCSIKTLQKHIQTSCKGYWKSMDGLEIKPETKVQAVGQKRPKLKAVSADTSKRHKMQPKISCPPKSDPDNTSVPTQLSPPNKKSVKTINSGSCIRQFSRPIVPPQTNGPTRDVVKTVKTLHPLMPPSINKCSDKVSKTSKSKNKAPVKRPGGRNAEKPGRVFSSRSLGLVDFDKIRTTARTRNMAPGSRSSRSLPDFSSVKTDDKRSTKDKVDRSKVTKPKQSNGAGEHPVAGRQQVAPTSSNQPLSVEDVPAGVVCNGVFNSTVESPGKVAQNGLNKEVKSFLILKVMPIVPANKSVMKPILPKQPANSYQKIQPKPQIVLQQSPKPLLVLKIPDCKGNSPQQPGTIKEQSGIFEKNSGSIKANKTYGLTPTRKRKSPSDSREEDEFDEEVK